MIIYLVAFLMLVSFIAIIWLLIKFVLKKKEAEKEKEERVPTAQDQIPIDYIRGRIVKLKQNGYRALIEIPSVNLDLMEPSEREIVLSQYRQILNSLEFPIQFLQQSRVVDISEYLGTLDKLRIQSKSKFIKNQLDFYSSYLNDLVKNQTILTKKFYVVVPFDPEKEKKNKKFQSKEDKNSTAKFGVIEEEKEFEKARKILYSRATMIERSFRSLGIVPHILEDDELLELYVTSYNKDRSVFQPVKGKKPRDYTTIAVRKE